MGINLPCGNKPLTTTECGGDCDEKIERLAERVSEAEEKLDTIQEGAEVNVNADWEETDPNSDAYIENKPSVNYDLSLGDSAPTVGSAVVGSAVLGSLVDIILGRGDGTEDRVSVSGTGAIQITRDGDTMTIHVPVGEIDQLRNGTDTEARAWAANVLKQWLDERIAQIPADQFLDLNKTVFANPFTWSSSTYPGSINPNLDGKPVLVLALTDGENVRYSFLNMEDLIDAYEGVAPISVNGSQISHDNSGVTAGSYGDASNQTPNFGDTFKALRSTVDAKGHVTSMSEHTVKIPDTLATQESAGLMSAEDKEKLDNVDQLYKTTCGNPIVIDDADGEVKKLNVELTPMQDLHGYDKPWAAGAGENKFDSVSWGALGTNPNYYTVASNGYITITANDVGGISNRLFSMTAGENYKIVQSGFSDVRLFDSSSASLNISNFTVPNDGKLALKVTANSYPTTGWVMIVPYSSTANAYEPYSNICPISPHTSLPVRDTGKNLFDDTDIEGKGGYWYQNFPDLTRQSCVHLIKAYPNTTYTLSKVSGALRAAIQQYENTSTTQAENPLLNDSGWKTDTYTFTTTANTHYIWVTFSSPNYSYNITASDVQDSKYQLELGDTATTYAPYTGQTVTVPLNDLYGGLVDVIGGESSDEWNFVTLTGDETYQAYGTTIVCRSITAPTGANNTDFVCNYADNTIVGWSNISRNQFQFKNADTFWGISDADEFKALIASFNTAGTPLTICYKLATPTPLITTPTPLTLYKGDNVISSDGDMCITYLQDRGDLTDFINDMKECCEEVKGSLLENLVDGSAQGSLRGIDTAQEDANYTIGTDAIALGAQTKASGNFSFAGGGGCTASGVGSFAHGAGCTASNDYGHAEGNLTESSGQYAHAEGVQTKAMQQAAHAEGAATTANALFAHAEGDATNATGLYAHSEGGGTTASGESAHAEGGGTTASAQRAHAEGGGTTASGLDSHAEGSGTTASGDKDHAEGYRTTASGGDSHAEGAYTVASGLDSHSEGNETIANHLAQHVFGEYNIADASTATSDQRGNYVEIVGNGAYNARSNARTLDWNGNEALQGALTLGKGTADEVTITAAQLQQLLTLI